MINKSGYLQAVIYQLCNIKRKKTSSNKLIEIVYDLIQKGIKFPMYNNWTIVAGGITCENLLNDINELLVLAVIKEDKNGGICIPKEEKNWFETSIIELNKREPKTLEKIIKTLDKIK